MRALGISRTSESESEKGCTGSAGGRSRSVGWRMRRRSSDGGATRPKKRPWSTEAEGFGSWPTQSSIESPRCEMPRGTSRAPRPARRATGAPKVRLTQQRGEGQRASEQGVVQHRHLDQEAAHAVGCGRGDLERRVRAQGRPTHHGARYVQLVEQCQRLAPEQGHRVVDHLGRAVGVAVPEQVEAEDTVPSLGQRLGQRNVDPAGEEQRRKEQHDLLAPVSSYTNRCPPYRNCRVRTFDHGRGRIPRTAVLGAG